MTIRERTAWTKAHQLPDGMLLISTEEMQVIQGLIKRWETVGTTYLKANSPELMSRHLMQLIAKARALRIENEAMKENQPPPIAADDPQFETWIPLVREILARPGAVKLEARGERQIGTPNYAVMLPNSGTEFVSREDRDFVLQKLLAP